MLIFIHTSSSINFNLEVNQNISCKTDETLFFSRIIKGIAKLNQIFKIKVRNIIKSYKYLNFTIEGHSLIR